MVWYCTQAVPPAVLCQSRLPIRPILSRTVSAPARPYCTVPATPPAAAVDSVNLRSCSCCRARAGAVPGAVMPVLGSPRPRIGLALYGLHSGSVLTKALALLQGRPVPRTSPREALHRRNRLSPCSNRARLQPAGGGQPPRSGRQRPGGALTGHLSLYRALEIDETERGLAAQHCVLAFVVPAVRGAVANIFVFDVARLSSP